MDTRSTAAIADLDLLQRACARGTEQEVGTASHVDLESLVRVPDAFGGLALESTGAALLGGLGDVVLGDGVSLRVEPLIWPPGVMVKVELP